ncbi:MAG: radical SAM protein [Candidatus Magnetomorum sp.]|nr:radical SAM protein [Candidatus Magnetomorum sp.]
MPKYLTYRPDSNEYQVVFHPIQSSWIIVNPTAAKIIHHIAEDHPLDMIVQSLVHDYGIHQKQALSDITTVSQRLLEHGFDFKQPLTPNQRIPKLRSLFIHITHRCNLNCPHCYVSSQNDCSKDLPTSVIIDLIDELSYQGGNGLTISGGEPLLHPDIAHILSYASKKLTVRLLTNGTKINNSMAKFLADQGIYVQISLDGSTPAIHDALRGAGCFDQIMAAIQRLQDDGAGDRLNLCTTLMQANQKDWPNIIALAEKNNIPLLRFLHLRDIGRANHHPDAKALSSGDYEKFIAHISSMQVDQPKKVALTCGMSGLLLKMPEEFQIDDIWCPVGRMLVIDTNGDTYPCVLMMRESYCLGNIFDQSLDQIIHSSRMNDICDTVSNRRYTIDKCQSCSFRNLCQAGCMGQALDHRDSLMETDVFCQYRKKAYAKAFDHLLQMSHPT